MDIEVELLITGQDFVTVSNFPEQAALTIDSPFEEHALVVTVILLSIMFEQFWVVKYIAFAAAVLNKSHAAIVLFPKRQIND